MAARSAPPAEPVDALLLGLRRPGRFTVERLRQTHRPTPFRPGPDLTTPVPNPEWEDYVHPTPLGGLWRFGARRRHLTALARYQQAMVEYLEAEYDRMAVFATAARRHAGEERFRRRQIERHNVEVDYLIEEVAAGEVRAVEDFVELILSSEPLPPELMGETEARYQRQARRVSVARELPAGAESAAQLALLTLRDVFEIRLPELVDEVAFTGYRGAPDQVVVSVSARRAEFAALDLAETSAADSLRRLGAVIATTPLGATG